MGRLQRGYIYEASGFFYVRYCVTEIVDGQAKRVQRSHKLAQVGASVPQENGGGTYHMTSAGKPCKTLKLLRDEFMLKINQGQQSKARRDLQQDMPISEFWEHHYLPYCEEIVQLTGQPRKRRSTVRGYKQIWKQHLKTHFANMTLQEYEPRMGTQFLQSLTGTQCKTTLKHIKAFGSSIFKRAVVDQRLKVNPWHSVQMPDDAIESERTKHYTLEEAEDLVSALVDHADCQLILALSCFLALRPGEIAALKWEDFDAESVHIRRSVVLGTVGTPKTLESVASLPLIDQVKIPLELWRTKSGKPKQGWVFKSHRNGKPVDFHNVVNRIIIPHVKRNSLGNGFQLAAVY